MYEAVWPPALTHPNLPVLLCFKVAHSRYFTISSWASELWAFPCIHMCTTLANCEDTSPFLLSGQSAIILALQYLQMQPQVRLTPNSCVSRLVFKSLSSCLHLCKSIQGGADWWDMQKFQIKSTPACGISLMQRLYAVAFAGAKTNDIIDLYVNTIKILRQVDSTGILLEAVSTPIHEYLQGRKDTIRCIMTAMTDDNGESSGESLYDELNRPAVEVRIIANATLIALLNFIHHVARPYRTAH